jgi:ribosomal 30S subunit maturation factor RimM
VRAGRIVGAFGLSGELKIDASRIGLDALRSGIAVTLHFDDGSVREETIATMRMHKGRPLVRIAGIADATAAEALGHADVLVARDDALMQRRGRRRAALSRPRHARGRCRSRALAARARVRRAHRRGAA